MNHQEQTKVYFTPKTETLHVGRSHSTSIPGLCLANEAAPHTLFRRRSKDDENDVFELEPLTLSMFFDGSILEIFANDRTAITTRVYLSDNSLSEIQPWIEYEPGKNGSATDCKLLSFQLWKLDSRS